MGGCLAWLLTMTFVFYGWLLFRAQSFDQIVAMTRSLTHLTLPTWTGSYLINLAAFLTPLLVMELWQFRSRNFLAPITLPEWARAALQGVLLLAIIFHWERTHLAFIYFQF